MLSLQDILKLACDKEFSYIYLSVGANIFGRVNSDLEVMFEKKLNSDDLTTYAKEILGDKFTELFETEEKYISFSIPGIGRFKANIFRQRNSIAISIKILSRNEFNNEIDIPNNIYNFVSQLKNGLVLIIGSINSGKNFTLSTIIQKISNTYSKYIITLESTIDILYRHNKSIVNQREMGTDTDSYISGIESAFRERPDILVIDDIPNYEVMKLIMKCCDAGILVIATFYSNSIQRTLEFLFGMEPKDKTYLKNILPSMLRCMIHQKNIFDKNQNNLYLFEFMINIPIIANCIRENNIKNLYTLMQNNTKLGICTMDNSLINAYKEGLISREVFVQNVSNKEIAAKIILNY
ncbi:type IV pilus twitching motility protein PilT [Candidatus Arthromitus sp. SFB-rat-Yit]|uniref:type IV pilus twitching motility protein PilT n=1 Tax=Candidatus Arthromitus sp. SFB-rat-Yit TaxID=1041504 RepID=UPI000227A0DC|nr:ATPase, T2SS/T4P/T4SS family [Candidatus Arthromitus sp. SFB-rat-Yit]BAK81251.1 putative twitching motility protein [Candidatus Arthromitus sp. SFB-rat-Yit]